MRKKGLNIQVLVELIILIGFSYLIYDLIRTGNVLYYIHPKMIKYLFFALITLTLMVLIQFRRLFTSVSNSKIKPQYLIFIVPLMMALVLEHQSISSSAATIRGVNLDSLGGTRSANSKIYLEQYSNAGKRLVLDPSNFMIQLSDILYSVEKYHGSELEIEGFIYREPHLEEGQIIITRTILSCCVADAENIGILSNWEEEKQLKENTWVRAIGTLQSIEYENPQTGRRGLVPLLVILELEEIPEPENPYIYP